MNTINFTAELLNAKIAENGRALIATAEEFGLHWDLYMTASENLIAEGRNAWEQAEEFVIDDNGNWTDLNHEDTDASALGQSRDFVEGDLFAEEVNAFIAWATGDRYVVVPTGKEMRKDPNRTHYATLVYIRDHEELQTEDGPYRTFATLAAAREFAESQIVWYTTFTNAGMRFVNFRAADIHELNSDGEPDRLAEELYPTTEKVWVDLDDDEREAFSDEFYRIWHREFDFADDASPDNPNPWGAPWDGGQPFDQVTTAEEYFKSVRRDIEEIHAMEVENDR